MLPLASLATRSALALLILILGELKTGGLNEQLIVDIGVEVGLESTPLLALSSRGWAFGLLVMCY